MPLAVAAIRFLNPAPLMWDFEHEPHSSELATRYTLRYMQPSACATEVLSGQSALGLIPIAALTPDLAVVPGCTIASLNEVRSILLLVKNPGGFSTVDALRSIRTIAADAASRSSVVYAHVLFEHFHGTRPEFSEHPADPLVMLAAADAALLIGDPALFAREQRASIDVAANTPLLWLDLAALWREHAGLPWVAAVWAVRLDALSAANITPAQLITDLNTSREHGLANIEALVSEWSAKLPLPVGAIRTYLTQNISYSLDDDCLRTIHLFRDLAARIGVLPPLSQINMLS